MNAKEARNLSNNFIEKEDVTKYIKLIDQRIEKQCLKGHFSLYDPQHWLDGIEKYHITDTHILKKVRRHYENLDYVWRDYPDTDDDYPDSFVYSVLSWE